ncbi:hypothetical protein IE4872_CH03307 [Rhizobium gallicum]|uniref:Uncharacterized protein n=1 Tax=Rhizobium gallicum TaxID=56730 RepID=A0A1L5NM02_9HYPH|nr:hypothetical protein IE4872_CH03307 [Rhizobium gallicum]
MSGFSLARRLKASLPISMPRCAHRSCALAIAVIFAVPAAIAGYALGVTREAGSF